MTRSAFQPRSPWCYCFSIPVRSKYSCPLVAPCGNLESAPLTPEAPAACPSGRNLARRAPSLAARACHSLREGTQSQAMAVDGRESLRTSAGLRRRGVRGASIRKNCGCGVDNKLLWVRYFLLAVKGSARHIHDWKFTAHPTVNGWNAEVVRKHCGGPTRVESADAPVARWPVMAGEQRRGKRCGTLQLRGNAQVGVRRSSKSFGFACSATKSTLGGAVRSWFAPGPDEPPSFLEFSGRPPTLKKTKG